jgi:hypothetical protein
VPFWQDTVPKRARILQPLPTRTSVPHHHTNILCTNIHHHLYVLENNMKIGKIIETAFILAFCLIVLGPIAGASDLPPRFLLIASLSSSFPQALNIVCSQPLQCSPSSH